MNYSAAAKEIWPGFPGAEQLPEINTIPNPFRFFDAKKDPNGDGFVTDPSEWTARRNEIKELVQRYWLGYRWPTGAEAVSGETTIAEEANEANEAILSGSTNSQPADVPVKKHAITVRNPDNGASASFNITVRTPSPGQMEAVWGDVHAKAPVIIDIGDTVSQVPTVLQQGYAVVERQEADYAVHGLWQIPGRSEGKPDNISAEGRKG